MAGGARAGAENDERAPRHRLVVAYDGSEPAVRAARFALGLFPGPSSAVWFVHAANAPPSVAEPRTDEERGSESAAIEQSLRALGASLAPSHRAIEIWVREGTPADVVLAAADEVDAEMIVVGTRGLRGASRLLLGSVSAAVVGRSHRPVVVVP